MIANLLEITKFQLPSYQIPMNAVLVIDKPAGLTSHDVVSRVRRIVRQRAVGHLGTLDPMATGVLPLVLGSLTRLAQFYTACEKVYEGTIRFGFATDTYDTEGEAVGEVREVTLKEPDVQEVAGKFRGWIEQTPPPFSAKKIHGVPAYKLARKRQDVELEPVKVEIKEFSILGVTKDRVEFRARVASGTYMRSVAHEMGQLLGCGAHLERLRRTAVGEFGIPNERPQRTQSSIKEKTAYSLEELAVAAESGSLEELVVHPRKLLPEMPAVTVTDDVAAHVRCGRAVNLPELSRAKLVKVFYGQRELIAIASRVAGTLFHPKIVLASSAVTEVMPSNRNL